MLWQSCGRGLEREEFTIYIHYVECLRLVQLGSWKCLFFMLNVLWCVVTLTTVERLGCISEYEIRTDQQTTQSQFLFHVCSYSILEGVFSHDDKKPQTCFGTVKIFCLVLKFVATQSKTVSLTKHGTCIIMENQESFKWMVSWCLQ